MSRLILFSGGVESTALLTLAKKGDVALIAHCSGEPETSSELVYDITTKLGVKTDWIGVDNSEFRTDSVRKNAVYQIQWLFPLASVYVARNPDFKEVWYGLHEGEPIEGGPFTQYMRWRMGWSIIHPDVLLYAPLHDKTKREQWDMIPDEIKLLVRNCIHNTNCGTCKKCKHLKSLPGSFWDCK